MSSSTPALTIPSLVAVRERLGHRRFEIERSVGARLLVLREIRAVIGFNPVVNPLAPTPAQAHLYDIDQTLKLAQMHLPTDKQLPPAFRGVIYHFHKYDSDLACIQDMGLNIFTRRNLPCLGFVDVDRILIDLCETVNFGEITEARTNGGLFENLGHQAYMKFHGFLAKDSALSNWEHNAYNDAWATLANAVSLALQPAYIEGSLGCWYDHAHYDAFNGLFENQEERNLLETIDVDKAVPPYLQRRTVRVAFDLEFDDANKKVSRPAEKVASLAMVFLDTEDVRDIAPGRWGGNRGSNHLPYIHGWHWKIRRGRNRKAVPKQTKFPGSREIWVNNWQQIAAGVDAALNSLSTYKPFRPTHIPLPRPYGLQNYESILLAGFEEDSDDEYYRQSGPVAPPPPPPPPPPPSEDEYIQGILRRVCGDHLRGFRCRLFDTHCAATRTFLCFPFGNGTCPQTGPHKTVIHTKKKCSEKLGVHCQRNECSREIEVHHVKWSCKSIMKGEPCNKMDCSAGHDFVELRKAMGWKRKFEAVMNVYAGK